MDKNIREADIRIDELNIDKIDFFLLLSHYKGKYGQL